MILTRGQPSNSSMLHSSALFLIALLSIKIIVTLCAFFIYAKFTPFLDAEYYLNSTLTSWDMSLLFQRTLLTQLFYASLKLVLRSDLSVHLFISVMLALTIWYVFKKEWLYINKLLFISAVLLPHFLIWTGVVGKEAIAIAGFLLLIKVCVDLSVWNRLEIIPLLMGAFLSLIERPHYAIVYLYLLGVSFFIAKSKKQWMSLFSPKTSLIIFLLCLSFVLVLIFSLEPIFSDPILHFMKKTQQYCLAFVDGKSNRWDIPWDEVSDFFKNMTWGMPTSIMGPTLSEALLRPILLPVFIEGCCALLLLILVWCLLILTVKKNTEYMTLILWGFLPALVVGLIINYPFTLFNPGSGVRYKQSLAPLLYFYPLLFTASIQRKKSNDT